MLPFGAFRPNTNLAQEATQNAALGNLPKQYATAALIESSAPTTDNYTYAIDTNTTYTLVAIGSLTVDHVTVLAALGTASYVWKAIDGLYGPNVPIFTDVTEPAAAEVANLLWWNSTQGKYRYSNGSQIIDVTGQARSSVHNGYMEVCPAYATAHKLLLSNAAAINAGAAKVQLLCANTLSVPYVSGDVVIIEGTVNYNGNVTLTSGTAADRIEFTATYVAETIPGTASIKSGTDATFQLNSTSKFIAFSWTGKASWALSTVSIYLLAVGTPGNLTLKLYAADSTGKPIGSALYDAGTLASGSMALSWLRKILDIAQQTYGAKGYSLVIGVENGVDVTVAGKRQRPKQDSGQPLGVTCWTSTDGGVGHTWTAFTQDSRPACFNVVVNSDTNHSPQAVFGRINGKSFAFLDGSSLDIPETGIIIPNTGLVAASTQYNIYGYNSTGTLALEVVTDTWAQSNGVKVKTGTTDHIFLGSIFGITRISNNIAPIECEKANTVFNEHNKQQKVITVQPYAANTSGGSASASFVPWVAGVDYTSLILTSSDTVAKTHLLAAMGYNRLFLGLSVDGVIGGEGWRSAFVPLNQYTAASLHQDYVLGEGIHTFIPQYKAIGVFSYLWYVTGAEQYYSVVEIEYMG